MNVIMLNPPFHTKYSRSQRSPAVIKSGVMYYPIWLAFATGVLEQDGFNVKLIDAPAAGLDLSTTLALIEDFSPRLVAIDISTPSLHKDIETALAIKNRVRDVFILAVGPHVPALLETQDDQSAFNAIAIGEYDYTVRDVARLLEGGGRLETVAGLSYRDTDGAPVRTPARPFIENLDALPLVSRVYRDHLRIRDYFYSITRYPVVAIVTGRGCPYQCTFCLWPQTLNGHKYRARSIASIADEFEFIAHYLPEVKEIFIEDDTLTVDQKRAIALAQELMRRGNRLPFTANVRADASYETLYWLRQAGLRLACVGFESGEQTILDAIKKNIKVEQFFEFRRAARRAGVLVHGCFMAGNPGESRDSLNKTLELAKKLNPDTAQFYPLMVYPGTEAYNWARRNGYIIAQDFGEWLTAEGLHKSVISYPNLSADDMVAWCDYARRSFYLRPRYLLGKIWEMLTHPAEAYRIIKAFRTFARYLFRHRPEQASVRLVRNTGDRCLRFR